MAWLLFDHTKLCTLINVKFRLKASKRQKKTVFYFQEQIAVKRIYKHPGFKNGELYDDIALIELDRRIEYDFDKVNMYPILITKER